MKRHDVQRLKISLLENEERLKELQEIQQGEPVEILANLQARIASYQAKVETIQGFLTILEPPEKKPEAP